MVDSQDIKLESQDLKPDSQDVKAESQIATSKPNEDQPSHTMNGENAKETPAIPPEATGTDHIVPSASATVPETNGTSLHPVVDSPTVDLSVTATTTAETMVPSPALEQPPTMISAPNPLPTHTQKPKRSSKTAEAPFELDLTSAANAIPPLIQLNDKLATIFKDAGIDTPIVSIWGQTLDSTLPLPPTSSSDITVTSPITQHQPPLSSSASSSSSSSPLPPPPPPKTASVAQSIILQKFLDARDGNVNAAAAQLTSTLRWRNEFQPDKALQETFPEYLDAIGTILPGRTKTGELVTLNRYGEIKDTQKVFGDLTQFLRWRVALMERGIRQGIDFVDDPHGADHQLPSSPKAPAPAPSGSSPKFMMQIHDYEGVSFWSRDAASKKAASEASQLFSDYYPEMLSRKFFINVPGWAAFIFKIFSHFLSQKTLDKFTMIGPNKAEQTSIFSELMDPDMVASIVKSP